MDFSMKVILCCRNGESSSARWQYWSRIKDVLLCFEKKLHVKKQIKKLLIWDQYCHLVVMKAPIKLTANSVVIYLFLALGFHATTMVP